MTKMRFLLLFSTFVLLFCTALIVPSTKQKVSAFVKPVASCSGEGCTDQSPYTTGCATDSYIVRSVNLRDSSLQPVGVLNLMYSPSCHSVWALNQVTVGTTNLLLASVTRLSSPTKTASNILQGSNLTVANSNMVYLATGQQARAAGYVGYTGGVYFTLPTFTAP